MAKASGDIEDPGDLDRLIKEREDGSVHVAFDHGCICVAGYPR